MGEDAGPGTAPPVEKRDPVTGKMVLMTKSAAKKLARRERREQKKESTKLERRTRERARRKERRKQEREAREKDPSYEVHRERKPPAQLIDARVVLDL